MSHFHCYRWVGPCVELETDRAGRECPARLILDQKWTTIQTVTFVASPLPPDWTDLWLLKRPTTTFWHAPHAVTWFRERHELLAPMYQQPSQRSREAMGALLAEAGTATSVGGAVHSGRYLTLQRYAAVSVIGCPSKAWPTIPCPL